MTDFSASTGSDNVVPISHGFRPAGRNVNSRRVTESDVIQLDAETHPSNVVSFKAHSETYLDALDKGGSKALFALVGMGLCVWIAVPIVLVENPRALCDWVITPTAKALNGVQSPLWKGLCGPK